MIGLRQARDEIARQFGFLGWEQVAFEVRLANAQDVERALLLADAEALSRLLADGCDT